MPCTTAQYRLQTEEMNKPVSSGLHTPSGSDLTIPSPAPHQTGLAITAISGPHDGEVWHVVGQKITVGREGRNDVCLQRDGGVSRTHMSLQHRSGSWFAQDENSSNGTMVRFGGQLMKLSVAFELHPGTTLQLGSTQLKVEKLR